MGGWAWLPVRPLGTGSNVRMNDRQKEDIFNYLWVGNVYLKVDH